MRGRFGDTGCLVSFVKGIQPDDLREMLKGRHGVPGHLRGHDRLDSFLQSVANLCALHASMYEGAQAKTLKARRIALAKLEAAAYRMQVALDVLRLGSDSPDVFEALSPALWYLAHRARNTRNPTSADSSADRRGHRARNTRLEVPATVPAGLHDLLSMIDDGLLAMRAACSHAAASIVPLRNPAKGRERAFARHVAEAHEAAFGELPPAGGWFGRWFVPELGERMGWEIGNLVVAKAVKDLMA
jgi:hypothetical protein